MTAATIETVQQPISFDTHHDDVIHDAKVDFYGRRLATASSDRTIRIFQINENQPETLLSILSGHEGPVWQVAWAHPKFGAILASCSYDGTVIIWQEDKQKSLNASAAGTHSTWSKIKIHRAHESSVNSICFAPHGYGLHLACASSDGKVSILSKIGDEWQSQVISAHSAGCNSVAWCPSAVPSSLLALDFKALEEKALPSGPKMIATGGCDNTVKIWKAAEVENEEGKGVKEEKWENEATLSDHTDWVRDVCWRPSMGQGVQVLVSCSQDNTVLIWKKDKETKKWKSTPLKSQPFPDTLWRVSFSEYGHLLAVSCGDNTVTLWREEAEAGKWKLVGNVDENVTETVKIDEPLAVSPPAAAPLPEINFTSSSLANQSSVNDVGYMTGMAASIPLTYSHGSTPGYTQFNQEYDDYQHAQTPTVPSVDVYNHEMPTETESVVPAFNKDFGFVATQTDQQYEQTGTQYEQQYEHQPEQYETQTNYQSEQVQPQDSTGQYENNFEQHQPQYDQTQYEQPQYEGAQQYDQQSQYEQTQYAEPQYEQQQYTQYDQTAYDQSSYIQTAYDQTSYDQTAFEQPQYDQAQYEQDPVQATQYPEYQEAPTAQEQQADYTLQYEGYAPQYENSTSL